MSDLSAVTSSLGYDDNGGPRITAPQTVSKSTQKSRRAAERKRQRKREREKREREARLQEEQNLNAERVTRRLKKRSKLPNLVERAEMSRFPPNLDESAFRSFSPKHSYHFSSGGSPTEEPVPKFSRIFGPSVRYTRPWKSGKKGAPVTPIHLDDPIAPEIDHMDHLISHKYLVPSALELKTQEQLPNFLGGDSIDANNDTPVLNAENALETIHPLAFTLAEQVEWEKDIIWDSDDDDDDDGGGGGGGRHEVSIAAGSGAERSLPSSLAVDKASHPPPPPPSTSTSQLWGALEPSVPSDPSKSTSANQKANEDEENIWGFMLDEEKPSTPNPKSPTTTTTTGSNPITHGDGVDGNHMDQLLTYHNAALASGEWLDRVIWDEAYASPAPVPLLLDMNDPHVACDLYPLEDPLSDGGGSDEEDGDANVGKNPTGVNGDDEANDVEQQDANNKDHEDSEEEDVVLDPFNWSNDAFYKQTGARTVRRASSAAMAAHAVPALNLCTFPTALDDAVAAKTLHRPRSTAPRQKRMWIVPPVLTRKSKKGQHANPMRRLRDLSAREGQITLVEYLEEYPPFLCGVGMASKMVNYYRKQGKDDSVPDRAMLSHGALTVLEPDDDSPLLGYVDPGTVLQCMENNLYKAPIVEHQARTTDFLLVRVRGGAGNRKIKWHIREIPSAFAAGQIQPVQTVFTPKSNPYKVHRTNWLLAHIYRAFRDKDNADKRLNIADLKEAFPDLGEQSIRRRLKDCAEPVRARESGWFRLREDVEVPEEEELRALVSPEHACRYAGMKLGEACLDEVCGGLNLPPNLAGLTGAVEKVVEGPHGKEKEALARAVLCELQLAPWHTTSNFLQAKTRKTMLRLKGPGDPSGVGYMFSYLKEPPHKRSGEKTKAETHGVTGTSADLRKLTLDELKEVLKRYFDVKEKDYRGMKRWDLVALVRSLSSKATEKDPTNRLKKFARRSKFTLAEQQDRYQEILRLIWDHQLKVLRADEVVFSSEDSDEEAAEAVEEDEDLMGLMDFMEQGLGDASGGKSKNSSSSSQAKRSRGALASKMRKKRKKAEEEDEVERRMFEKFQAEQAEAARRNEEERNVGGPSNGASTSRHGSADGGGEGRKRAPTGRMVLRRRYHEKLPDGTLVPRVEIIRDQAEVERIRATLAAQRPRHARKRKPTPQDQAARRAKRRKNDQLRRLRARQRKAAEGASSSPATTLASPSSSSGGGGGGGGGGRRSSSSTAHKIKCGACGQIGHMRTNRACPMYNAVADEYELAAYMPASGHVKLNRSNPLCLSISRAALEDDEEDDYEDDDAQYQLHSKAEEEYYPHQRTRPRRATAGLSKRVRMQVHISLAQLSSSPSTSAPSESPAIRSITVKRKPIQEPAHMVSIGQEPPKRTHSQPHKEMTDLFRRALKRVLEHPYHPMFLHPVTDAIAPGYSKMIRDPICLSDISGYLDENDYRKRADFLGDLQLMVENCRTYNAVSCPYLVMQAEELMRVAERALDEEDHLLRELEACMEPQIVTIDASLL